MSHLIGLEGQTIRPAPPPTPSERTWPDRCRYNRGRPTRTPAACVSAMAHDREIGLRWPCRPTPSFRCRRSWQLFRRAGEFAAVTHHHGRRRFESRDRPGGVFRHRASVAAAANVAADRFEPSNPTRMGGPGVSTTIRFRRGLTRPGSSATFSVGMCPGDLLPGVALGVVSSEVAGRFGASGR